MKLSKRKYTDPITGDPLSWQEHLSWRVQGVIRHWAFLILFTCATITCWLIGSGHPDVLIWWNLVASYMAIFIESIVGIAMFSQTRRDAVIIRGISRMDKDIIKLVEHLVEEVEELNEDLA